MSLLSAVQPLMCDTCPFLKKKKKGTCYNCYCYLDKTINLDDHCDNKTYPIDCPLTDGRVVTIKAENGHLLIERD